MGGKPARPKSTQEGEAEGNDNSNARSSGKKSDSFAGAYLVYSTESGGVLTLYWSEQSVTGALAYFRPRKAVPEHKKTQNAGRLELIRGIASSKKKMYEGVIHFVKEAVLLDGDIKQFDNQHFDIWYYNGTIVNPLKVNEVLPSSKIKALAVLPHQNASFKGVKKIDVDQFVNTALREGAAWKH